MAVVMDIDLLQRDDPAYWAAALVLAVQDGDTARADTARRHLRRLGWSVERTRRLRARVAT